jgi:iron(III) transport system permease protein
MWRRKLSQARRGSGGERAALAALFVIVALLSVTPLVRLLLEAFVGGDPRSSFAVLDSPAVWRATRNSLLVSAAGALGAVVAGGGFAFLVALTDLRGRAALIFCFMLPLTIAPQVTALSWIELTGVNSAVLRPLGLAPAPGSPHPLYGAFGIALLFMLEQAPVVFLAAWAGLRGIPAETIEAAETLGAKPRRILATVILPQAAPALAAGGALAFAANIGNFGIPAFLGIPAGYPMLVTAIYQRLAGFGPRVLGEVAVMSLLLAVLALAGLALYRWIEKRRDVQAGDLGGGPRGWALGPWRLPLEIACWLALGAVLLLPLLALVAGALVPAVGVPLTPRTATFENFAFVLLEHDATRRAFVNSAWLSASAAVLLVGLAVPLGYLMTLGRSRFAAVLGAAAELPYALPGIVLSIAAILCLLKPLPLLGIGLYNTVWIILLAYLSRFYALALRPVAAAMRQIEPAVDEAAALLGATFRQRMTRVLGPLVAPAAGAGAIMVFLTAFNELTVSALLWSSGAETVGVVLFGLEQAGEVVSANAVATISVIVTVVLMLAANAAGRRLPRGVLPWRP